MVNGEHPVKAVFVTAVSVVLGLAGVGGVMWLCWGPLFTGSPSPFSSHEVEDNYPSAREEVWEDPAPPEPQAFSTGRWSCFWDPTMNDNWHDDVLCVNGQDQDRPILLPDWGFVTQEDILAEAAMYETYLNGPAFSSPEPQTKNPFEESFGDQPRAENPFEESFGN